MENLIDLGKDITPFASIQQLICFLLLGADVWKYILDNPEKLSRDQLYGYYTGEKRLAPGGGAASAAGSGRGPSMPPRETTPATPPLGGSDAGSEGGGSEYGDFFREYGCDIVFFPPNFLLVCKSLTPLTFYKPPYQPPYRAFQYDSFVFLIESLIIFFVNQGVKC